MKPPEREFRPTVPPLRDRLKIMLFAILSLAGTVGWARTGNPAPTIVCLLMMGAGTWVYYRLRILGSPRLRVGAKGFRYRRGKTEVAGQWTDIERFEADFYRDELHFIRRDGGRPVKMHKDMTAADGTRFEMVIEEYWTPPKR